MSWGPLFVNLAVTAAVVAVLMLGTFGYAMLSKVHAIMDTIWPLGFVLIALVSFFLSAGSGSSASGAIHSGRRRSTRRCSSTPSWRSGPSTGAARCAF